MPRYPPTSEPTSSVASPVTASIVPPMSTPAYKNAGNFTILAKARIKAHALCILTVIRNTNDWHLWNTFSPICRIIATSPSPPRQLHPDIPTGNEGWLESNTLAKLDIFMQGNGLEPGARKNRDVLIAVTLLEQSERDGHTVYTLAWKNNQSRQWKLHTERVVELVDTGDGWTDYTCHETFGGFSSSFVKKLVGNTLLDRSGDIASNLKTYMEGGEPVEPKGSLCDGRGKGSIRGAKKPRRKTRLQIRQEERRMNTNSSRRQSF